MLHFSLIHQKAKGGMIRNSKFMESKHFLCIPQSMLISSGPELLKMETLNTEKLQLMSSNTQMSLTRRRVSLVNADQPVEEKNPACIRRLNLNSTSHDVSECLRVTVWSTSIMCCLMNPRGTLCPCTAKEDHNHLLVACAYGESTQDEGLCLSIC